MKLNVIDFFKNNYTQNTMIGLSFIVGIISYICHISYYFIDADYWIYYNAVNRFWTGQSPYTDEGFLYTEYFCIIFSFLLLPPEIGLIIRIITNISISIYFIHSIKTEKNIGFSYWIIVNIITIYYDIFMLNINTLIALILYLIWNHKSNPNYYFLVLVIMFKITVLVLVIFVVCFEFIYDKKIGSLIWKQVLFIFTITSITYLISYPKYSQMVGSHSILLLIQPAHIFSYSIILPMLFDLNLNILKKFSIITINQIIFLVNILMYINLTIKTTNSGFFSVFKIK